MVDATNSGDENEAVKAGRIPREWDSKPAKLRQKDRDARWTKKHGKSFFGYKNHVNADAKHKLIRRYEVTDAAVHDSQKLDGLLNKGNTSAEVFADDAYRSAKIEAQLRASGFKSRIHRRGTRNHPLSDAQAKANRNRSKIRARVEHVFGAQETSPGADERQPRSRQITLENSYAFMQRNAERSAAYFCIPATQVVEIGIEIEI